MLTGIMYSVCVCRVCVCVVSVIVKRPVLPLCVVDGRSRNPLYYYYVIRATFHDLIDTLGKVNRERVVGFE